MSRPCRGQGLHTGAPQAPAHGHSFSSVLCSKFSCRTAGVHTLGGGREADAVAGQVSWLRRQEGGWRTEQIQECKHLADRAGGVRQEPCHFGVH